MRTLNHREIGRFTVISEINQSSEEQILYDIVSVVSKTIKLKLK